MFGFGVNITKYFRIEIIPKTNLTNTLNYENNKVRDFGAYMNWAINLPLFFTKNQTLISSP